MEARDAIDPNDRIRDPEQLLDLIKNSQEAPSEEQISRISEIALQEIFGLLAEMDEEERGEPLRRENVMRWLYGLLCLLEKPLLADQAAELNQLLGRLNLSLQHCNDQG